MIAELAPWALAFAALACLLSGFAHGALGFGFPIVATPLVALVIDIKSAIALLAPVTLLLVLISVVRGGGLAATLRRFWVLPLVIVAGSFLGTRLLMAAPPEPFILVLAAAILLYLNLDRLGRGRSPLVERSALPFGLAFGFAAGFFEAVANVAGPILLIYFMLLGLGPVQLVQALNLCFTFGKGTQVTTLIAAGAFGQPAWVAMGLLAVPSVAALWYGMSVRERIDAATYRRWLRGALWVMVALLLMQFAHSAFSREKDLFEAIEEHREQAAAAMVLRGGLDLNARNARNETALHRAVEKGMKDVARVLVKAGVPLHARTANGETALHLAALHAEPFFAELLLGAGANPNVRNDDGESPLFWAVLSGHDAVARLLLAKGADPDLKDLKGRTARDVRDRK